MRIIDALQWGEQQLKGVGLEYPRWDADLLLGYVLGLRREQLYLDRERVLNSEQLKEYRERIERRVQHEPLQYILKHQEFMGLDFHVDDRVLIPRPDSELLIEKLLEFKKAWAPQEDGVKPKVVDICTGSGALAISAAYYWPEAKVVGTDLSSEALDVARYNSEKLGVQVEWRQGDFLVPICNERWDILISNPPYISNQEYNELAPEIFREPKMAFVGGEDGLDFYRELANQASSLLKPNGKILLEIGWQQGEAVETLFRQQGFETRVFKDYGGRDRVVFAR
jgi:release factor glutamine methyltransferase